MRKIQIDQYVWQMGCERSFLHVIVCNGVARIFSLFSRSLRSIMKTITTVCDSSLAVNHKCCSCLEVEKYDHPIFKKNVVYSSFLINPDFAPCWADVQQKSNVMTSPCFLDHQSMVSEGCRASQLSSSDVLSYRTLYTTCSCFACFVLPQQICR